MRLLLIDEVIRKFHSRKSAMNQLQCEGFSSLNRLLSDYFNQFDLELLRLTGDA